ncbi:aldo/keto reductase [Paenibacillus bovis]|uniref:Aldo/keto reductase n=1 Tax=Paenibacillus bovis TaxID=1616788 RepID=A0A172ZFN6_9BACL|nr:aldo/keto reductase [Paenibacillus bovis]ANF96461.1 aldo/keto reductase [Paenibacillus bovis]
MPVNAMINRRKLGNTGLEVSPLSLGAAPLGHVFGHIDEDQGVRAVLEAFEQGVNLVDTSPYYGVTRSEQVLGRALRQLPRERYILSTKAGRYNDREFDFSRQRILDSVDESLQRLGTDYADILLLHDIEFGDLNIVLDEAIPALQQLKQEGKIRFYGVSCLPLEGYRRVLEHTDLDVILSYCHYTLNDSTLTDLLPLLEARGIGVINAAPVAMGLLSDKGPADWHPASPEIKQRCREAAEFCRQQGSSLTQLAIQYAVSNERLTTTIVGTASTAEITDNIRWAGEPIDLDVLQQVLNILAPVQGQTWPSGHWTREILEGSRELKWQGSPF